MQVILKISVLNHDIIICAKTSYSFETKYLFTDFNLRLQIVQHKQGIILMPPIIPKALCKTSKLSQVPKLHLQMLLEGAQEGVDMVLPTVIEVEAGQHREETC